jgi:ubiquinone/menaquinone biosynthesis C-methylase UbiE
MKALQRWILEFNRWTSRLFTRWAKHPHHDEYYRELLDRCLARSKAVVHLGCGGRDVRSLASVDLSGVTIYAVDPSEASIRRNPNPNQIVAFGHDIPLPSGSIDLIFCEYLMEHVEDPEATITEAHRLLRPGGILLWMAPNLWSYSGLITHLTPDWFHRLVIKVLEPVAKRTASEDVFPTYFRINSIATIERMLEEGEFELEELFTSASPPFYTLALPVVHQLAILFHLVLDRFEGLRGFRLVQIVRARKLAAGALGSAPAPGLSASGGR